MSREAELPRTELWNERTVAWYERADRRSDYAAKVFGVVAELLVALLLLTIAQIGTHFQNKIM